MVVPERAALRRIPYILTAAAREWGPVVVHKLIATVTGQRIPEVLGSRACLIVIQEAFARVPANKNCGFDFATRVRTRINAA